MPEFDSTTFTRDFLTALFPEDTIDPFACGVITGLGTAVAWCTSLDEMIEEVEKRGGTEDVYFSACLMSKAKLAVEAKHRRVDLDLKKRRGYAQSAQVMPGVWLDLDVAGDGHQKQSLPPTIEDAMAIVDSMPGGGPTLVVETGGGIHAWWLFSEPFVIETEDDFDRARTLNQGWSELASIESKKRGWAMDSVFDLARIMRVPGTKNHKPQYEKGGRPVRLGVYEPDRRHDQDALEIFLPDVQLTPAHRGAVAGELQFEVNPDARPDMDLVRKLIDMDKDFRAVWEFKTPFVSQSERDLSIATRLAGAGVNDQEIVNCMIYSRSKNPEAQQSKRARHDYLADRINAARVTNPNICDALEQVSDLAASVAGGAPMTAQVRESLRDTISVVLQMPPSHQIIGIERFDGDPATYNLVTSTGQVSLPTIRHIYDNRLFREAVGSATGHTIDVQKAAAWHLIAAQLVSAAETVDIGTTRDGETVGWVEAYVEEAGISSCLANAIETLGPFVDVAGGTSIMAEGLRDWLNTTGKDRAVTTNAVARRLKRAGFQKRKENWTRVDGRRAQRSCWGFPPA